MLGRVRVAGHSMEPALHHGDELLFLRLPPRLGAVVVARDPRDPERLIVKRVAAMHDRDVVLSSDSLGHETLVADRAAVIGWAILRYRPSLGPRRGLSFAGALGPRTPGPPSTP